MDAKDTDASGTLLALVLDPLFASLDKVMAAAPLRDFEGPAFGPGSDPVGREPEGGGAQGTWSDVKAAAWAVHAWGTAATALRALPRTDVVTAYAERFGREADDAEQVLARHAASKLLRRCGLDAALARARQVDLLGDDGESLGPASRTPGLDSKSLGVALRSFYSTLFANPAPDLDDLDDPTRKKRAQDKTHRILSDAHAAVYELADHDVYGDYPDKADFLVHTPSQVRVLLDVQDDDP